MRDYPNLEACSTHACRGHQVRTCVLAAAANKWFRRNTKHAFDIIPPLSVSPPQHLLRERVGPASVAMRTTPLYGAVCVRDCAVRQYLVLKRRVLVGGVVDRVHEEDGGHVVLSQEQPQHGPGLHAAALRLHADETNVSLKEVAAD